MTENPRWHVLIPKKDHRQAQMNYTRGTKNARTHLDNVLPYISAVCWRCRGEWHLIISKRREMLFQAIWRLILRARARTRTHAYPLMSKTAQHKTFALQHPAQSLFLLWQFVRPCLIPTPLFKKVWFLSAWLLAFTPPLRVPSHHAPLFLPSFQTALGQGSISMTSCQRRAQLQPMTGQVWAQRV